MFRTGDLIALVLYFGTMIVMGIYFTSKNKSTEDYFLGNRSFPGWAVGLSMLGTSISSVTFLALPAAAFALDCRQFVQNLGILASAWMAWHFFIPFFRQGRMTSAFEYLEARYGNAIRCYSAVSFIVLQFIRLATILYLIALPMTAMTGFNLFTIIIVTGVVVGIYTIFGGFEAVIWTDVVQTILLLGGGVLCVLLIAFKMPGGFSQIIDIAIDNNKLSLGPMGFDLNERTFWVMLLLGIIGFMTEYSSNQNVIQRYIAAKSTKEARKATLICIFMGLPTWASFFFLGVCLFAFYTVFGRVSVANLEVDQILPHFIFTQIPTFVAGSIIAACFAAAMSSLSSSINGIATIGTIDFFKRFGREKSDKEALLFAKVISLLVSVGMIVGAIAIYYVPKESINDLTIVLASLLGGGLLSIYMLGFFTKRVSHVALLIGLGVALLFNSVMMLSSLNVIEIPIHSYWTSIIVNLVLAVVAYSLSWVFPNRKKLDNLTVWTLTNKENANAK